MSQQTANQAAVQVYRATIRNCQRMQPKFAPETPQATLLVNRIAALQTVMALVDGGPQPDAVACRQALAPIRSIIHKLTVAQAKQTVNSATYRRLAAMLSAMQLGEQILQARLAEDDKSTHA